MSQARENSAKLELAKQTLEEENSKQLIQIRSDHDRETTKLMKQLDELNQTSQETSRLHTERVDDLQAQLSAASIASANASSEAGERQEKLTQELNKLKVEMEETAELLSEKTDKIESLGKTEKKNWGLTTIWGDY